MRLEQLYYFVKVADTHSFSSASNDLFLSQQALSTSIKKLEEEFHAKFFYRTSRGVSLSDDGQYFYDVARQMLALFEQLQVHFAEKSIPLQDNLRIGVVPKTKDHFFPKIISYFLKEYPQFHFKYHSLSQTQIISDLQEGKLDVGVVTYIELEKKIIGTIPEEFQFIPFYSTDCSLVTSCNSPISHFQQISMSTIVKHPLIIYGTEEDYTHNPFYHLIMNFTDHPDLLLADSYALQDQLVESNLGNAFYTRYRSLPSKDISKIIITNNIMVHVGFLIPKNAPENHLLDLLIKKTKYFATQVD